MITMIKVSMAKPGSNTQQCEEKIQTLEDKKRIEEQEVSEELKQNKEAKLNDIKHEYNQRSLQVKINFEALLETLKR